MKHYLLTHLKIWYFHDETCLHRAYYYLCYSWYQQTNNIHTAKAKDTKFNRAQEKLTKAWLATGVLEQMMYADISFPVYNKTVQTKNKHKNIFFVLPKVVACFIREILFVENKLERKKILPILCWPMHAKNMLYVWIQSMRSQLRASNVWKKRVLNAAACNFQGMQIETQYYKALTH